MGIGYDDLKREGKSVQLSRAVGDLCAMSFLFLVSWSVIREGARKARCRRR